MVKQFFTIFLGCFLNFCVIAADFNDGLKAFNSENYTKAYKIWIDIANGKTSVISDSFKWNKLSDEQKKDAQYGISLLYWQGKGVEQDYEKAMQWLVRSANNGHKDAALKLGFLHLKGLVDEANPAKARIWFLKAAKEGLVDAQYNIGLLLLNGVGGAKDLQQAKYWFQQAAKQGDVNAQKQLASLKTENITNKNPIKNQTAQKQISPVSIKRPSNDNRVETKDISTTIKPKPSLETSIINEPISPVKEKIDKKYAVKIAALSNYDNVSALVKQFPNPLWRYFTKEVAEKKIYVLLHCCFETKTMATTALQALPLKLKEMGAYVIVRQP